MVPMEGVEPTHSHEYQIFSLGWNGICLKKIVLCYLSDCFARSHLPNYGHTTADKRKAKQ